MYNSTKTKPMFTIEERVAMVQKVVERFPNVEVATSDGLLAEYAKQFYKPVIVKGLRAASDFEYEFQMNLINKKINPELETMFLTASENTPSSAPRSFGKWHRTVPISQASFPMRSLKK